MDTVPALPVALVDDHALFRGLLAEKIDRMGGYKVVLEAGNGEEFVEAMRNGPHVSVAIVDLHMPIMDGYATLAWIREHLPGTRALALTFENTEEALTRSVHAGACGFLLKDSSKATFQEALQQVATVGYYHQEHIALMPEVEGETSVKYAEIREQTLALLTAREMEFLRWVGDPSEFTYDRIAELMGVHPGTINGYRASLFEKLKIKSKSGLVIFAYKLGLVKA